MSLPDLDFSSFSAVLLDLDGTVYHEDHALPGAIGLIRKLQESNIAYACLTNSTSSPAKLAARLSQMGVTVDETHIYTAASAACDYVLQHVAKVGTLPRVYNLGSDSITELLDGEVTWVNAGGEPCDAVIVGTPTNPYASEDRRRVALQLLRKSNAKLVGICADRVYPSPRGIEFGAGALSHFLAYAAHTTPVFAGKPNRIFFEELCTRLSVLPDQCLMIGDNLEADIAGAKNMGMKTVLTLTGVTRRRDLLKAPETMLPDWVIEDLTEL